MFLEGVLAGRSVVVGNVQGNDNHLHINHQYACAGDSIVNLYAKKHICGIIKGMNCMNGLIADCDANY